MMPFSPVTFSLGHFPHLSRPTPYIPLRDEQKNAEVLTSSEMHLARFSHTEK